MKELRNKSLPFESMPSTSINRSEISTNVKIEACSPEDTKWDTLTTVNKNRRKRESLDAASNDDNDGEPETDIKLEHKKHKKRRKNKKEEMQNTYHTSTSLIENPLMLDVAAIQMLSTHNKQIVADDFQPPNNDTSIQQRLTAIEDRLTALENNTLTIISLLRGQSNAPTTIPKDDAFMTKYDLHLPCESIQDLNDLNEILGKNQACCHDLIKLLSFRMDGTCGIAKATTQILKLCITRDLALQLTAQKQMPGKTVIKSTPFCDLLSEILTNVYVSANEKQILWAIGDALSNSKDWHGFRKKRAKKDAHAE